MVKPHSFPSTRWSVVARAGRDWRTIESAAQDEARDALHTLCESYYYPALEYLRRSGSPDDEAHDVLHEFFIALIQFEKPYRDLMRGAEKGVSFRACLLTALKSHISARRQMGRAKKRGGDSVTLSIDAGNLPSPISAMADDLTAEQVFEAGWARQVTHQALKTVADGFDPVRFDALKPYLFGEQRGYETVARSLGLSVDAVKQTIRRIRLAFANALRAIVMETVNDAEEVDAEIGQMRTNLRAASSLEI